MLPKHREDVDRPTIHLLGFNITNKPIWLQFTLLSLSVFGLYVSYGYVQELIFKLPAMKPFGWYLTFLQFLIYTVCAYGESVVWNERKRNVPIRVYMTIAFLTVTTMGLSNASVGYLNYPTMVIFKCCKLIPVLIGGILIQGKRYGMLDISAAVLMSFGIIVFTLADSKVSPNFDPTGYFMISGALLADAVIGNVQEKSMKQYGGSTTEMVLFSYGIGSVYILFYLLISGELFTAFPFFYENAWHTYGYGLIFGLLGYLGVNVVLNLVKRFGALLAVTVTTLRKALTIIVSFLAFSKPFTIEYLWGGLIILAAIYLNLYSKNKTKWDAHLKVVFASVIGYKATSVKNDYLMV